jgi:hypothetical protein
MGQPSIIEISYQEFLTIYRRATDSGKKIDVSDKDRWSRFVRENNIPEAGMAVKARAGVMSGKTKVVIIDGAGKADGYYIYSPDALFCLKYDLGRD